MLSTYTARIALLGVLSLVWLGAPAAHALLITHNEVHVFNVHITPQHGSLDMSLAPWTAVATASAFDDLSGTVQAFDDDSDGDGIATAAAATRFASASSRVSSDDLTIDVLGDMFVTSGTLALNTTASGTLFTLFTPTETTAVTFSLDYTAALSGQVDALGAFRADYGISLVLSDGGDRLHAQYLQCPLGHGVSHRHGNAYRHVSPPVRSALCA